MSEFRIGDKVRIHNPRLCQLPPDFEGLEVILYEFKEDRWYFKHDRMPWWITEDCLEKIYIMNRNGANT